MRLICQGLNRYRFRLKKIFDIRADGDHPKIFHEKCDGIPQTIFVLEKNNNQVIGGYTAETWEKDFLNFD